MSLFNIFGFFILSASRDESSVLYNKVIFDYITHVQFLSLTDCNLAYCNSFLNEDNTSQSKLPLSIYPYSFLMWSDNIGNMFVIFLHSGRIIPNIRVNIDIIIINYSTTTSFNKHEISYTYILTVYNILDHFLIIHYERE
jgi:hypothetical protein